VGRGNTKRENVLKKLRTKIIYMFDLEEKEEQDRYSRLNDNEVGLKASKKAKVTMNIKTNFLTLERTTDGPKERYFDTVAWLH